jgi:hypothetical protein
MEVACCKMCGVSIPDGQEICSMCMGDVGHGSDGHYLRELEREEQRAQERRESESE